jgi:hypothetical protein
MGLTSLKFEKTTTAIISHAKETVLFGIARSGRNFTGVKEEKLHGSSAFCYRCTT